MAFWKSLTLCLFFFLLVGSGVAQTGPLPQLRAVWFDWAPCHAFQTWALTYPNASITVDCVPLGEWHTVIWDNFALGLEGIYDLLILDSQFIGEGMHSSSSSFKKHLLISSSLIFSSLSLSLSFFLSFFVWVKLWKESILLQWMNWWQIWIVLIFTTSPSVPTVNTRPFPSIIGVCPLNLTSCSWSIERTSLPSSGSMTLSITTILSELPISSRMDLSIPLDSGLLGVLQLLVMTKDPLSGIKLLGGIFFLFQKFFVLFILSHPLFFVFCFLFFVFSFSFFHVFILSVLVEKFGILQLIRLMVSYNRMRTFKLSNLRFNCLMLVLLLLPT